MTRFFSNQSHHRTWWPAALLCLSTFAAICHAEESAPEIRDPFHWKSLQVDPLALSVEGAYLGLSDQCIVLAGGWEEDADSRGGYSNRIHLLNLQEQPLRWRLTEETLPIAASAGATVSHQDGFICIGGEEAAGPHATVFRIDYLRTESALAITPMQPLPFPPDRISAAVDNGVLYVLGSFFQLKDPGSEATPAFWAMDLKALESERQWRPLALPAFTMPPVSSITPQYDGYTTSLYVFTVTGAAFRYHPGELSWEALPTPPLVRGAFNHAMPVGTATVFKTMWADPEEGIPAVGFQVYNTITERWAASPPVPGIAAPLALLADGDRAWIPSFEGDSIRVHEGVLVRSEKSLSKIDLAILFGYFAVLIIIGYHFSKKGKSTADYFKAGKRIPGWAMGISLIVTSLSSISFISLPAKAFATDWLYFFAGMFTFVGALLVYFLFLPFFTRLNVTTAYEYLEKRYDFSIRALGGSLFLASELFRMGTVTYMPALALSVVTGMDIYLCILMIGVIATIYTILGGIEAVIWTDVLQVIIMFAGLLCAIGVVFARMDVGVFEAMGTAYSMDKFHLVDFSLDLSTVTVWVVFISLTVGANPYISNQAFFQRLVTTKNPKETGKGLIVKSIVGPFIVMLLFFTGTCLFMFYHFSPGSFNPALSKPDQILPWFIVSELPVGVSGLMIGAIFAASMSTLDSGMNSICTVCINDFYSRFAKNYSDARALRLAKILTLILGMFGTGVAIFIAAAGIKTMIDFYFQYLIIFTGGVAGIYMLGFFTVRGNSAGAWVGFFATGAAIYFVKFHTDAIFFTYGFVATLVGSFAGYGASLLLKGKPKSLDGLTFFT